MSTRISVGLDNSIDGYRCGQQALGMALSSLSNPSLVLLFTSHPEPEQVLRGVLKGLGKVPLIGCTSAGEYTRERYVQRGAGILLIQSESMQFHALEQQTGWFRKNGLFKSLLGLPVDQAKAPKHHVLMLFSDNHSRNLDTLVDTAATETGRLYDIIGGCAPFGEEPHRGGEILDNRRILRHGLSGVEIISPQRIGLGLANGWATTSEMCCVTEVAGHRLITIDDRPAIEVYEEYLRTQGVDESRNRLTQDTFLKYPIGLGKTIDSKVCQVAGVDESGALTMTTPPHKGSSICFLSTRPDAMIAAVQRAIQTALADLQEKPAGLLLLDCQSNALLLGDAYAQQRAMVKQMMSDVPYLGVRTHGMLVNLPGQNAGHYEGSVGACLFPS